VKTLLLAVCALAAISTALVPPAVATIQVPVCVGYAMCEPCNEGYAWIGVEDPFEGKWICGQCEVCGNPIWLP
jgi:hypothetical protein